MTQTVEPMTPTVNERLMRAEVMLAHVAEGTASNTDSIAKLSGLLHSRPSWSVATVIGFLAMWSGAATSALLSGAVR